MAPPPLIQLGRSRDPRSLERALRASLQGEVRFDAGSRALYATDASNYRQVPIAVVIPKDNDDVSRALEACRKYDAPVLCRGGGTSLAGQCCNVAVVFDFTKYCRGVLEIDREGAKARVLPGTILDELQRSVVPLGLRFGPDPSTHSHCTLGGMIGNNSCGVHAVLSEFYGKGPRTEDNVEQLVVETYDGTRLRVGPTSDHDYARIVTGGGRRAEIYRKLRGLVARYGTQIRSRYPQIPRRVSGFNLPALLPENGFNVARALAGSEGTCATILEATVSLAPSLPARAMIVVGYPSIYEAGDDIPRMRELRPVGCEGIDDRLVEYMRKKHQHTDDLDLLPKGSGWLLLEFGAETAKEAEQQARAALNMLSSRNDRAYGKLIEDPARQQRLWEIRKSALAATAFVPGQPDAWPGWEDAAVPVERIGRYLRAFRKLLDQFGYSCSLYGHFAQGCVHTRIDFDLQSEEGIRKYRNFTEAAAQLVIAHGGSLSGEHGDGQARADLLEHMYGGELLQAFREFKSIWDPRGRMNPGKVVDAHARTEDLRLGAQYDPWRPKTHFAYAADQMDFSRATLRCVGVGKCRRELGGIMCPSYMVTREERHCTRGRAHLLFEMLRGDVVRKRWRDDSVKEALDLCLACKGCKSECPVNVDIAQHKAEYLSHYYHRRLRPRAAFALGLVHWWAQLAALMPRLVNYLVRVRVFSRLIKWIGGIAPERSLPAFAARSFQKTRAESSHIDSGSSVPQEESLDGPTVILWPDTFTNHFHPAALRAAERVLLAAGCRVVTPSKALCCGRPLYDFGMLDLAKRQWRQILDALGPSVSAGAKVVGLEPSCVAAFRDELPELVSEPRARQLSRNVFTLAEFLIHHVDGYVPPQIPGNVAVQWHCHHRSVMSVAADRELLARTGAHVEEVSQGCCGMAGAFGFEKNKYWLSRELAERELVPNVEALPKATRLVADGFSCREQIAQLTGRRAIHLAELLADGLTNFRTLENATPAQRALPEPDSGPTRT